MYYIVVPEYYDNYTLYPFNRKAKQKTLIAHELLTIGEYIKHHETYDNMPDFRDHIFSISKTSTYNSFGCRFLSHDYRAMEKIDYEIARLHYYLSKYPNKSGLKKA